MEKQQSPVEESTIVSSSSVSTTLTSTDNAANNTHTLITSTANSVPKDDGDRHGGYIPVKPQYIIPRHAASSSSTTIISSNPSSVLSIVSNPGSALPSSSTTNTSLTTILATEPCTTVINPSDDTGPTEEESVSSSSSAAAGTGTENNNSGLPRKRNRGQNKHRNKDDLGLYAGKTKSISKPLCRFILASIDGSTVTPSPIPASSSSSSSSSSVCRYGDNCRDNHSIETYLASRPPDLGKECYVFSKYGVCPSGIQCRWGLSHTNLSSVTNISSSLSSSIPSLSTTSTSDSSTTSADPLITVTPLSLETNKLSFELSRTLNRSQYTYTRAIPLHHKQYNNTNSNNSNTTDPSHRTLLDNNSNGKVVWRPGGGGNASNNSSKARIQVSLPPPPPPPPPPPSSSTTPTTNNNSSTSSSFVSRPIDDVPLRAVEKKIINFERKIYVAPLTTVGNLPFRRVCKDLGADITCGEMALTSNLVTGSVSEWALLRRHASEDIFGIQIAGCYADNVSRAAELIANECTVDFVDINCGCPLDAVVNKGMGAGIMSKPTRLRDSVLALDRILPCAVTVKMRTGFDKEKDLRFAHKLIGKIRLWSVCDSSLYVKEIIDHYRNERTDPPWRCPVAAVTVHGRTRQQRYSSTADWDYIKVCANAGKDSVTVTPEYLIKEGYQLGNQNVLRTWNYSEEKYNQLLPGSATLSSLSSHREIYVDPPCIPIIGNGDVISLQEFNDHIDHTGVSTCLLARGVLIKPWLCTEIKEHRPDYDISSKERLEILQKFVNYGLEHWGSDQTGVNHVRRFLLEWLSFLCRYIPLGILERIPQRIGDRARPFYGRDDLETLMASTKAEDWVKISELLLGPVPDDYQFLPKHKSSGTYEGANEYGSSSSSSNSNSNHRKNTNEDRSGNVNTTTATTSTDEPDPKRKKELEGYEEFINDEENDDDGEEDAGYEG